MDKPVAIQVIELTEQASRLLDESAARVQDAAPERAASVYRSSVGRAMGEMAAGILFRLWREHPELEPAYMSAGPSAYDPRDFQMPPEAADEAIRSLQRASEIMTRVATLLSQEPDPAEREVYAAELACVTHEIREAMRGVERRSKPMDSGRPTKS